MKIIINNFYHDSLKKFNEILFEFFNKIAIHFESRKTYHIIMHIQTNEEKREFSEWFDNFKKSINEIKKADKI